jgi:hypothetical protein
MNEKSQRHIDSDREVEPVWLEDAAEVYSVDSRFGSDFGVDAETACRVLEAAGIPCYLDFCEEPEEGDLPATHRWRVLVPGNLNMRATSVLERDIFNDSFETVWKTHLEMLSDRELREAKPKEVFCGLFDRIERVVRTYNDELSRRSQTPGRH